MKHYLFAIVVLLLGTQTSCNKEGYDSLKTQNTKSFTVSIDAGTKTRASENVPTRYIMEIYEGTVATGTPTVHREQAGGNFEGVILLDKQAYVVLFWADYGTKDNNTTGDYDASDLKAARVVSGKTPTQAAFAGVSKFTVGTDDEAVYTRVTLSHAVAQVNFEQTKALTAEENTLVVTYPESYSLNVADFSITKIDGGVTHTFAYNHKEAGTLGTSYLVAATGTVKTLMDITATLNGETAKAITSVPFERNFRTNISGAYSSLHGTSFSTTCDDNWETPDHEGTLTPPHIYNKDTKAVVPAGEGTEAAPYLLASAANIKWLQELSAYGTTNGKYFKLMSDIEVTSDTWTPIAVSQFNGFFDGNGHRFTGKLVAAADHAKFVFGIFGRTSPSAEIRNLTNAAEVIAPNVGQVGGIVGLSYGKITNCKNTAKITAKYAVGGIVGYYVYANTDLTSGTVVLVSSCENSGEIIARERVEESGEWYSAAGGILGDAYFQPAKSVTDKNQVVFIVENCSNTGNVSAPADSKYVGGIIGRSQVVRGTCKVKGCTNTGTVKSGETIATQNIGADNKLGLLAGGQYTGYSAGATVIE